jgi:hypothetical protein
VCVRARVRACVCSACVRVCVCCETGTQFPPLSRWSQASGPSQNYVVFAPEVQSLSLLPRLPFFIYFSATSCPLVRPQSVTVSASKFLKTVQGMYVSVADCIRYREGL